MAVLVDTGWKFKKNDEHSPLFDFIRLHAPELCTINRFVLTHEDSDHCQGAADFLYAWAKSNRKVEQAWLPALWSVLEGQTLRKDWIQATIVKGAFEAAEEVQKVIDRLDTQPLIDDEILLKAICQAADESGVLNDLFRPLDIWDNSTNQHPSTSTTAIELEYDRSPHRDWPPLWNGLDWYSAGGIASILLELGQIPNGGRHGALAIHMADSAIQTHKNIAPAIAACLVCSVPIRWFDFKTFELKGSPAGGDPMFLTPVNSVEVARTTQSITPKALFYALSLSRANRESHVYVRHQTIDEPAVLFTADSRLSSRRRDFPDPLSGSMIRHPVLATAMHHGSDHNGTGYSVLKKWLGNGNPPVLVRNGGYRVRRLAKEFHAIDSRQCVACHGIDSIPILVRIESHNGCWQMPVHPRPCNCR